MGQMWPLTGRVEELRFVAAAVRAAGARGVVLEGAAGVGKTRLAREAMATAERRGMTTRWVAATASARSLPLGAFAGILGAVGGDPTQLLGQAMDALLAGGGRNGVVVGVDDAHLLDELSALLVHQLVMYGGARVVVTVRSGEPVPDAVSGLWKDGHLDRLEVQPLSETDTAAVLEPALGGPVDRDSAAQMWSLTGGNALYLRHLVDGELESGRLRQVRGVWRWSRIPVMSPGLTELVDARMGQLPDQVREVVDVLALGEPLGVSLLQDVTDPAAVEQAEARGLVRVERDERRLQARLAHPLYGEARRAQLGELRARRLRGRIAEALAGTGARRSDDTLRRAVLALESDLPPDTALLGAAALQAANLIDVALAEQLARAAFDVAPDFDAGLTLAYAVSWQGRVADGEQTLAAILPLAASDEQRVRANVLRVANLFFGMGKPQDAEAVLRAALATVNDADARDELNGLGCLLRSAGCRLQEAVDLGRQVLQSTTANDRAVTWAAAGLTLALGLLGRVDELREVVIRAREVARRCGETSVVRMTQGSFEIPAFCWLGLIAEAERLAAEYRELVQPAAGPAKPIATMFVGQAALARGRVGLAVRRLREAQAGLAGQDPGAFLWISQLSLTQALAVSEETTEARRALAEAESRRHPSIAWLLPELVLARAWVAAAEGATTEAIALAYQAAEVAAAGGQAALEVVALQAAVRFDDRNAADRLAELATQVGGPRAPAVARHAAALAGDDGDALHAASVQLEQMGDVLAAADAAAQAASAHTRRGRRGAGEVAAARAQRLAQACDGARTPALVASAHPLPLTNREREIVTLAAQGLSNQQIADRLFVSVRTVEGHLYRASAKLGVTKRGELAALLHGE